MAIKSKNKNSPKTDYRPLRNKVLFQFAFVSIGAIFTVAFLYIIYRSGRIADIIVFVLESVLQFGHEHAVSIYQVVFRDNADVFMLGGIVIAILLFLGLFMKWFTKYFEEINSGIDSLIDAENEEIILSAEMHFVQEKLNTLKRTLTIRKIATERAEQKKNDLVIYLAHDIKTPLTSVIGYLSLLDEAYPQVSAQGQEVLIHVPEDMLIFGDADKLARVFNNILKNAIAYSRDNSSIDISAKIQDSKAIIAFKNAGTIPNEKLTAIFDKFYRLDDARTSSTGGSGLGLAIAKEIVTLHGGTIQAQSKDQHTIFTVELPIL